MYSLALVGLTQNYFAINIFKCSLWQLLYLLKIYTLLRLGISEKPTMLLFAGLRNASEIYK